MTWSETRRLILMDLFRYGGRLGIRAFLQAWRYEPGFRLTLLMRLCTLLHANWFTRYTLYVAVVWWYRRAGIRFGVYIHFTTKIGGGLYIPHALAIVVHQACVIGENCNLSQGVTLGVANRGERKGTPVIGDNVYIGPGAVVFGAIHIDNNVAIGANAVVNRDVPENGVMVGVPARLISTKGSTGYVNQVLVENGSSHDSGRYITLRGESAQESALDESESTLL